MTAKRLLPPEVFDALHLSSLEFGGIGGGDFRDCDGTPLCAYGHVNDVPGSWATMECARISPITNDKAVRAINKRRGAFRYARVTFEEWCAELNIDVVQP